MKCGTSKVYLQYFFSSYSLINDLVIYLKGRTLYTTTSEIDPKYRVADMTHEHHCACGALVDKSGIHGLFSEKNITKYAKHRNLNNIIHRALHSANVPAKLEHTGLLRDDGNLK